MYKKLKKSVSTLGNSPKTIRIKTCRTSSKVLNPEFRKTKGPSLKRPLVSKYAIAGNSVTPANIPETYFESQVESESPSTITFQADQRQKKYMSDSMELKPEGFAVSRDTHTYRISVIPGKPLCTPSGGISSLGKKE
ncbi:MAG: hypothetical protein AAF502_25195 [Bacteroidota bacterium]